jgi:flavin reductase (DIM6/NTAB) family NADH-FMN oxidoreductase RutF
VAAPPAFPGNQTDRIVDLGGRPAKMGAPPEKVSIPLGRKEWHPSPLLDQLVLVTTVDREGRANIAPKASVCVAAVKKPMVGFSCSKKHRTWGNIEATKEFVINVPDLHVAERSWKMAEFKDPVARDMRNFGLTPLPSVKVKPPRVREARAHLECRLESSKEIGSEVFVFGDVVEAAIDRAALEGPAPRQYRYLHPAVFLEKHLYAGLGGVYDAGEGD